MKITADQLRRIIKEEVQKVVRETRESETGVHTHRIKISLNSIVGDLDIGPFTEDESDGTLTATGFGEDIFGLAKKLREKGFKVEVERARDDVRDNYAGGEDDRFGPPRDRFAGGRDDRF